MSRHRKFGVVTALLAVAAFGLTSAKPAEASLLLGGTRIYTTAGLTVVVEGWLAPELMDDPAAYLSFWAQRSDQPGVQASDPRLQGGVVIPRGSAVKIKVYAEPGNDDFGREMVIHQYSAYDKFGMRELARCRGLYKEFVLNSGTQTLGSEPIVPQQYSVEAQKSLPAVLTVGSNAIRAFLYAKGKRNPQAYLGVGIVVAPNPKDVKRQAELITQTGMGEYLVPQTPIDQQPAPADFGQPETTRSPADPPKRIDPLDDGAELRRTAGTVVVTTNRPTAVKLFVSGVEVASHDVRDRRVFENVPIGSVSIKMKLDGGRWTVKQPTTQTLVDGGQVRFDLRRNGR